MCALDRKKERQREGEREGERERERDLWPKQDHTSFAWRSS